MKKYSILKTADFEQIADQTKYSVSYIRQVIRGYVPETDRNHQIIEQADQIVEERIKQIQS